MLRDGHVGTGIGDGERTPVSSPDTAPPHSGLRLRHVPMTEAKDSFLPAGCGKLPHPVLLSGAAGMLWFCTPARRKTPSLSIPAEADSGPGMLPVQAAFCGQEQYAGPTPRLPDSFSP